MTTVEFREYNKRRGTFNYRYPEHPVKVTGIGYFEAAHFGFYVRVRQIIEGSNGRYNVRLLAVLTEGASYDLGEDGRGSRWKIVHKPRH